ncbi:MFS transporter [Alicyclobacillaceae bacterium I2511]|nr:MFS transporter [Alicyclobacillaceae bacterium I2511]
MSGQGKSKILQARYHPPTSNSKWIALFWITLAELFVMSVWFSASAVIPALAQAWHIKGSSIVWLTSAVQLGFVLGALTSATFGLPDRIRPRWMMGWGGLGASLSTAGILLFPHGGLMPFILRGLTGAFLAVVYPIAVQWVATWFPRQRGLAVGILIGGLTVGSALPHLFAGLPILQNWQGVMAGSAVLAGLSWVLVLWVVPESPVPFISPVFRWNTVGAVLRDRPVMLANMGYWGHMWELYAMWTWLPGFLLASWGPTLSRVALIQRVGWASFTAIGLTGILGALVGGWLADEWGRTAATIAALTVSGTMSLVVGLTYRHSIGLTLLVILIWGFSVIADSAQFSAAVTELSPANQQGSALTLQMAVGFLITIVSINLVGMIEPVLGWSHVFTLLALGPLAGIGAMMRLRVRPESTQMSNGKR